ncbi:MAG: hypothetical protein AAF456_14555 [Planctomycetota bacterium]
MNTVATTHSAAGRPLAMTDLSRTAASYRKVFSQLGFTEHQSLGCMKFTGVYEGRQTTVAVGVRSRNRYATPDISYREFSGLILDIHVDTSISTYLMVLNSSSRQGWLVRWLQRLNRNHHVESLDALLPGYHVFAREPQWAQKFVESRGVMGDINLLLREDSGVANGNLLRWGPGSCGFTPNRVPDEITTETAEGWMKPLADLATAAEANPPLEEAEFTWLGKQAGAGRMWMVIPAVLLGIPVALFLVVLCIAICIVLVS